MKTFTATLTAMLLAGVVSFADSRLEFQANDTVKSVLERQAGQSVELRLKSGEKIAGKLEKVGDKLAHVSQLAGAEFFEAAVSLDEIAAVVVRAKAK